jgi:hypothetical protein
MACKWMRRKIETENWRRKVEEIDLILLMSMVFHGIQSRFNQGIDDKAKILNYAKGFWLSFFYNLVTHF